MERMVMARTDPRPNYGSGRRVRTDGYIDLWRPGHELSRSDGYVFEHRLVLHDAGLIVPLGFEVHHIDEDRANNALDNLAVLTPQAHHRLHHQPDAPVRNQHGNGGRVGQGITLRQRTHKLSLGERICIECDGVITEQRTDARFCSGRCRLAAWRRSRKAEQR